MDIQTTNLFRGGDPDTHDLVHGLKHDPAATKSPANNGYDANQLRYQLSASVEQAEDRVPVQASSIGSISE